MVTVDWKSLNEPAAPSVEPGGVVSTPVRHQGVRDALRNAFSPVSELPSEFAKLLGKLG